MRRLFSALVVATVLAAPMVAATSANAGERPRASVSVRVYDPYRRDSHNWDRQEERRYRAYLAERHRSYRAYQRQKRAHQRDYWRWRHEREERFRHERR
jgi:hypothetical protein